MRYTHHLKKAHKVTHTILTVVIMVLLPVVVATLITAKSPVLFGIRSFVIVSGSMQPTLPVGTLIYVKKESFYKKGEIIAFDRGDIVVSHRIVEVKKKGNGFSYRTKGDANNAPDTQIVNIAMIEGKLFFSVPYIGSFIYFLRTIPGFIICIVIPTIIFILFELYKIKKEIEKEVEKKLLKKLETTS